VEEELLHGFLRVSCRVRLRELLDSGVSERKQNRENVRWISLGMGNSDDFVIGLTSARTSDPAAK
jgi:hypothetical protein